MTTRGAAPARALAGAALLVGLAFASHLSAQRKSEPPEPAPHATTELRALWVLRSSLASPERIATLVGTAKQHGFNTLFVQVRGRGDAYYAATIEPRAAELARASKDFDPLARLLTAAHAADLRVHAWINVNLVSSATYLPKAPSHLVNRHPEWLMVPRELAPRLARTSPSSPAYVAALARWTRTQTHDVEGLYASPATPAAIEHVRGVVREIVRQYPLDGVHFDYARYPNDRFDYSRTAILEFRRSVEASLSPGRRRELAARETKHPLAFPDALPDDWRRFRESRLTALMTGLREVIRAERPATVVSVAVKPDAQDARDHRLQDWPKWLNAGLIDAVSPMAYTTERDRFTEQIGAAVAAAGDRAVWAGIGAYRLSPEQTIQHIATARKLGAGGIVLFSYDSLLDPRQTSSNYLSRVGRAAFATVPAATGSR